MTKERNRRLAVIVLTLVAAAVALDVFRDPAAVGVVEAFVLIVAASASVGGVVSLIRRERLGPDTRK